MKTLTASIASPATISKGSKGRRKGDSRIGVLTYVSAATFFMICFGALFAPWIAPYDPYSVDFFATLQPPSWQHLFGTDLQGRDLFSRVLFGARLTLFTSFVAIVVGGFIGAFLGLVSVFIPWTDMVIGRLLDVLLAFPAILFGLALAASMGQGTMSVVIALCIATIPEVGRIARSTGMGVMQQEYMESGKTVGLGNVALFIKYLAWNSAPTIFTFLTLGFGSIILLGAGLNFLGLGAQSPLAELGTLAAEGRNVLPIAPHIATFPSLTIFVLVLSLNVLGDAMRDHMDTRLI